MELVCDHRLGLLAAEAVERQRIEVQGAGGTAAILDGYHSRERVGDRVAGELVFDQQLVQRGWWRLDPAGRGDPCRVADGLRDVRGGGWVEFAGAQEGSLAIAPSRYWRQRQLVRAVVITVRRLGGARLGRGWAGGRAGGVWAAGRGRLVALACRALPVEPIAYSTPSVTSTARAAAKKRFIGCPPLSVESWAGVVGVADRGAGG